MKFFIEDVSLSNLSNLVAWCSYQKNAISIYDFETQQEYAQFSGAGLNMEIRNYYIVFLKQQLLSTFGWIILKDLDSWAHVKEIPSTPYLVSLQHSYMKYANMEVFDISKKGQAKKIYTHETLLGGNIFKFPNLHNKLWYSHKINHLQFYSSNWVWRCHLQPTKIDPWCYPY